MLVPVPRVQVLVPLLTLPRFRKGEFMHGVALDDEVRGATQHVTAVASGGRGCSFTSGGPVLLAVFVPVEWADVPDEWRGAGAAAAVAVVLRDCCASRSYARWYWQANSDGCITCSIDGGYVRAYGAVATRECLRCPDTDGRPTLRFVQFWF